MQYCTTHTYWDFVHTISGEFSYVVLVDVHGGVCERLARHSMGPDNFSWAQTIGYYQVKVAHFKFEQL